MTGEPAISPGPIAFTEKGNFFLIPLSALVFDAAGALKPDNWPLYGQYKTQLDPFLQRLQGANVIAKGPEPATGPALKATAVSPGAAGVVIKMIFANVTPNADSPPSSTADVTVEETNSYTAVHLAKLVETIGNAAGGGTRPGLVFVSGAAPTHMPAAGQYDLKIAASGKAAKADVARDGGSGNAFTLQARSADQGGALISAQVSDVDTAAETFTLSVSWKKSVSGVAISALASHFAFVVAITPPDGSYRAPATGTFTLAGGSDAVSISAVKAAATIPEAS